MADYEGVVYLTQQTVASGQNDRDDWGEGRQGVLLEPPLVSDYRAEVVTDGPQQDLIFEVRVDVVPPTG
jgi:hypothetical protein